VSRRIRDVVVYHKLFEEFTYFLVLDRLRSYYYVEKMNKNVYPVHSRICLLR
jgi:hypothetical protein